MNYSTVLFDFHGVLCKERFYEKTLAMSHPEIYGWIQSNIFADKKMVGKWMRNQISSAEINRLIVENNNIEFEKINKLFESSVRAMRLDRDIENIARALKRSDKKIGIVTDNMDVFTQITVPEYQLNKLFNVIINSADHGMLKRDNNGKLFEIALVSLEENIENSLMIDDSESTIELYKKKGGSGFVYRDAEELKKFLLTNLQV